MNFAFFGTDKFSVTVLNELKSKGLMPGLIVTAPDRPAGRGQHIHESEVKIWAKENNVSILQPIKLDAEFIRDLNNLNTKWDVFALASYGRIVPQSVLEIPNKGILNVHPSLLPQYRGASPIESAILDDNKDTGVTIMLMDEKMDHGPIIDQQIVNFEEWEKAEEIENRLGKIGGEMLAEILPVWVNDDIDEQEQDHELATFTKKITKEDGLIDFKDLEKIVDFEEEKSKQNLKPEKQRGIFLKVMALNPWPGAYFFVKHGNEDLRVKIVDAKWIENKLKIISVIPAGRKEMSWDSFVDGFLNK
jgi:methionyl-tRNA formyltransferase